MRKFILAKSVRVSPIISFLLRVDKFPQKAKEAK